MWRVVLLVFRAVLRSICCSGIAVLFLCSVLFCCFAPNSRKAFSKTVSHFTRCFFVSVFLTILFSVGVCLGSSLCAVLFGLVATKPPAQIKQKFGRSGWSVHLRGGGLFQQRGTPKRGAVQHSSNPTKERSNREAIHKKRTQHERGSDRGKVVRPKGGLRAASSPLNLTLRNTALARTSTKHKINNKNKTTTTTTTEQQQQQHCGCGLLAGLQVCNLLPHDFTCIENHGLRHMQIDDATRSHRAEQTVRHNGFNWNSKCPCAQPHRRHHTHSWQITCREDSTDSHIESRQFHLVSGLTVLLVLRPVVRHSEKWPKHQQVGW